MVVFGGLGVETIVLSECGYFEFGLIKLTSVLTHILAFLIYLTQFS